MSDKEFYTIREIILGTRKLYIENQKLMSSLRSLTESCDKQVSDFYFEVKTAKAFSPYIRCKFIQNLKTFKGRMLELKKKMNTNYYGYEYGTVVKKENGLYEIRNKVYKANIIGGKNNEFGGLVFDTLNSEFITKLNFSYISGSKCDVMLTPHIIVVKSKDTRNQITLIYDAKTDRMEISDTGGLLNENILNYILNYKIPANDLTLFHKQIIDGSEILQKDLFIKSSDSYRKETIVIDEKDHEVELVRIKSLYK